MEWFKAPPTIISRWYSLILLLTLFLSMFLFCLKNVVCLLRLLFFLLILYFFTTHQQTFSYKGTGLPGLNPYLARINVSCSRTQCSDLVRLKPAAPRSRVKHSTTEPLPSLYYVCCIYSNAPQITFHHRSKQNEPGSDCSPLAAIMGIPKLIYKGVVPAWYQTF